MEFLLSREFLQREIPKTPIYKSGLVHDIYRFGDFVIKISKTNFPDFNSKEHFLVESASLNLLARNGIPTPNEVRASSVLLAGSETHFLVEPFIDGIQLTWQKLDEQALSYMADIYKTSHMIEIKGFGPLNGQLEGAFDDWNQYLNNSIEQSREYFAKHIDIPDFVDLFSLLKDRAEKVAKSRSVPVSKFVLVDLNPGNIFFDKKGNLLSVIDIDHPMGGDEIFEFASMYWYNRDAFQKLQDSHLHLNSIQMELLKIYSLIHGSGVIVWMDQHGLNTTSDVSKLIGMYDSMAGR